MKSQCKLFNLSKKRKLPAGRKLYDMRYEATGQPIPVAVQSKLCLCGRKLAGIADSNPTGGMNVSLFLDG